MSQYCCTASTYQMQCRYFCTSTGPCSTLESLERMHGKGRGGFDVAAGWGEAYLSIIAPLGCRCSNGRNADSACHVSLSTPVQTSYQLYSMCTRLSPFAFRHSTQLGLLFEYTQPVHEHNSGCVATWHKGVMTDGLWQGGSHGIYHKRVRQSHVLKHRVVPGARCCSWCIITTRPKRPMQYTGKPTRLAVCIN